MMPITLSESIDKILAHGLETSFHITATPPLPQRLTKSNIDNDMAATAVEH